MIDRAFMEKVMQFCDKFPCSLDGGWRTVARNRVVGGAKGSQHLQGRAVDLIFDSIPELFIAAQAAQTEGFGGVELDMTNHHLHLDGREVSWHVVQRVKGRYEDLTTFLRQQTELV